MRITKEALATNVVVRRQMKGGSAPFGWEVRSDETAEPLYVSSDRFTSMAEAYGAGLVKLRELVPEPSRTGRSNRWQPGHAGIDADDAPA